MSQRPPAKKGELEEKYAGLLDKPSSRKGGYRESKEFLERSEMDGVLLTKVSKDQFTSTNNDATVKPATFPADLDFSREIRFTLRNGRKYQVAALYQLSNRRFGPVVACAPIVDDGIATKDEGKWVEISWDSVLSAYNRQQGFLDNPVHSNDEETGWDGFQNLSEGELSADASSLSADGLADDIDDSEFSEMHASSDDEEIVARPGKFARVAPSNQFGDYREYILSQQE